MSNQQDFAPLPTYQETRNSNAAWVQVTLTKSVRGISRRTNPSYRIHARMGGSHEAFRIC
jgi:hypothetical protein